MEPRIQEEILEEEAELEQIDGSIIGYGQWFKHSLNHPAGCNYCNNLIIGFNDASSMCKICRIMVCSKHLDEFEKSGKHKCRPEFIEGDTVDHHWISGNVTHTVKNAGCMNCSKRIPQLTLFSRKKIQNYRCSWCERTVCQECFDKNDFVENCDPCDLGPFANIRVDPRYAHPNLLQDLPNDPLIVIINNKSGGGLGRGQGTAISRRMKQRLHPLQVCDLFDEDGSVIGPRPILELFGRAGKLSRVLICSGDGAVCWPMDVVKQLRYDGILDQDKEVTFIPLPLGTGCDFSRITGWGSGYNNENIGPILEDIEFFSRTVPMDRWIITRLDQDGIMVEQKTFILYFSIGVSSEVMLDLDQDRKANPEKYSSRTGNKMQIGLKSGKKAIQGNYKNLSDRVAVTLDGSNSVIMIDPNAQSIDLVNGPSYAAGTDLWGDETVEEKQQFINDGFIEMLTHQGILNMASVKFANGSINKVAKVEKVVFTFRDDDPIHIQYDGEAFVQNGGSIEIERLEQVLIGAYDGDEYGKDSRKETFKYVKEFDEEYAEAIGEGEVTTSDILYSFDQDID